jgi:uncharacterized membrane protein
MIANSAFLAAMVLMLVTFLIAGQLSFLAPYKHLIVGHYGSVIVAAVAIAFINLFAVFYLLTRALFLKDTGRKLAHVEKQLRTGDSIVGDLSARLAEED